MNNIWTRNSLFGEIEGSVTPVRTPGGSNLYPILRATEGSTPSNVVYYGIAVITSASSSTAIGTLNPSQPGDNGRSDEAVIRTAHGVFFGIEGAESLFPRPGTDSDYKFLRTTVQGTNPGGHVYYSTVRLTNASTIRAVALGAGFIGLSCSATASVSIHGIRRGTLTLRPMTVAATVLVSSTQQAKPLSAHMSASAVVHALATTFRHGALQLFVNEVNRSSWLAVNSVEVSDALNTRNTAMFKLNVPAASVNLLEVGQPMYFTNGVSIQFAGTLDKITKTMVGNCGVVTFEVEAVDHHQIFDRHRISRVFTGKKAGEIIKSVCGLELLGEGIDTAHVADGPVIEKAVYNQQTVTDMLNELSQLIGYVWYVDYSKSLYFIDYEALTSPWNIEEGVLAPVKDFRVEDTRENYRNRQYVMASKVNTFPLSETFVGDATTRSWSLSFPIAKQPDLVTVNNVVQSVGVKGETNQPDKDWYYSVGDKQLSQNEDSQLYPPLTPFDTLVVHYVGQYDKLIMVEDTAAQAARAAIEGGTGIYENTVIDQRIETEQQAIDHANALLTLYSTPGAFVEFDTDRAGLRSGQTITISLPTFDVSGDYLVTETTARDIGGRFLRYHIRLNKGKYRGSWVDFYRDLAGVKLDLASKNFLIRDDEVLNQPVTFPSQVVNISDSLNIDSVTPVAPVIGVAVIGSTEI